VGTKVVIDLQIEFPHLNGTRFDGPLLAGFSVCLRLGATVREGSGHAGMTWTCFDQFAQLSLTATRVARQAMEVAYVANPAHVSADLLNRHAVDVASLAGLDAASQVVLREQLRVLSIDSSVFSAEDGQYCAGRMGEGGCGRPVLPHCTSPTRFRFYLYPVVTVPTFQAAEVYYALRDSPLRTHNPDPAYGEPCVYIAIGDVYAANVQVRQTSDLPDASAQHTEIAAQQI
jgi:hypothetical protein